MRKARRSRCTSSTQTPPRRSRRSKPRPGVTKHAQVVINRWRSFDKISALEKAVKILRLYDKPPPPPPEDDGLQHVDDPPSEIVRRVAFMLERERVRKGKAKKQLKEPA